MYAIVSGISATRRRGVLDELGRRVHNGVITPERFPEITGVSYEERGDE